MIYVGKVKKKESADAIALRCITDTETDSLKFNYDPFLLDASPIIGSTQGIWNF